MTRPALSTLLLAWLVGCGSYRYDLAGPADVAGPVSGTPRRFDLDPLRYAVATGDDRLSIEVTNPTGQTVRLLGGDSSVVDPAGQSHPLIDQTIAPAAAVKVVLPPLRPWGGSAYDAGNDVVQPSSAWLGSGSTPGYDRANPVYWDWPGPGRVRVHLVFRRADGTGFAHDLAFDRQRQG